MSENANIRGSIKLDNLIETGCFTSIDDFLKRLPDMLTVEIPADVTNVTIGSTQPNSDQLNNLWIKKDNSGSFVGLFLFAQGGWNQVYPVPQELHLVYGDSTVIPTGYQLASDDVNISPTQLAFLQLMWHSNGGGGYDIFHISYAGF